MAKVGIVMLADTETHGDLERAVNALETAKESIEADDEVKIIFDGAGTRWPAELADENHTAHSVYKAIEEGITGVCDCCARAFLVNSDNRPPGDSPAG
ncbi:MAG TPA: hypothetical protein VKA68_15885 [bacterium]|nr:hypothetical protein [bacterium]